MVILDFIFIPSDTTVTFSNLPKPHSETKPGTIPLIPSSASYVPTQSMNLVYDRNTCSRNGLNVGTTYIANATYLAKR